MNAKHLDPRPRDLTDSMEATMVEATNEEIFDVISKGGREVALSPFMPPFGNTLSEAEIWSLVAYIRTLHPNQAEKIDFNQPMKTARPSTPTSEEISFQPETDQPERMVKIGERFYTEKYGCDGCHRINGMGGEVGPDLSSVGSRMDIQAIYRWLENPQSIDSQSKMPNYDLPERDIKALTLYLKSLGET
jgi:mono/diheme cytochrome c family protein